MAKVVGVDIAELFVLLAEMDLASGGDDRAKAAASGAMHGLQARGDIDRFLVRAESGTLVIRWWSMLPGSSHQIQFAIAGLKPEEAAVIAVMTE